MKKTKRIAMLLVAFALCLCMSGEVILSAFCVSAAEVTQTVDLDTSDPLDDLDGCMIEGVGFSLQNWGFDKTKNTQVFNLLEYGYGYREKFKETLELYVYIYNPQNKVFLTGYSGDYSITMRIQGESDDEYIRYRMEYISSSQKEGFERLFYKYKVVIPSSDMSVIWPSLNMPERVYEIGEVQLVDPFGKVIESLSGSKYVYTGYMAGCGVSDDSASTLQCKGFTGETLSLDVNFAYYRPSGTNGSTKYTQDSLHSCYFAVPKRYIEDYGEMVRVRAQWYDALLKPMLITGNGDAWEALKDYTYDDCSNKISNLNYAYVSNYSYMLVSQLYSPAYASYTAHYRYNFFLPATDNFKINGVAVNGPNGSVILDSLYLVFPSAKWDKVNNKWQDDTADTWVVSGLDVQLKMESISEKLRELGRGEDLFSTKYNSELFEKWDNEPKITVIDKYNADGSLKYETLTSVVTTQNLWQKFWGTSSETSTTYDDIQMIKEITDADFGENDSACAAALYVSEGDYAELKYFYEKNKNDFVVYLVRYQISEYTAEEATLLTSDSYSEIDTNAYFAQMTINVDFDIIDVTFRKDNIDTVMPVSMVPLTFIPDVTPPVNTTSDASRWDDLWDFLKILLFLIGFVVLGVFVMPFVIPGLRIVWKVIRTVLKVGWNFLIFIPKLIFGFFKRE